MNQRNSLLNVQKRALVMILVFVFSANQSIINVKAQDYPGTDPTLMATTEGTADESTGVPTEILSTTTTAIPANHKTESTLFENDLVVSVEDKFLQSTSGIDPSLVFVSDIKEDFPWASGLVGTRATDTQDEPSLFLFLAKNENSKWTIALEFNDLFTTWMDEVPSSIFLTEQKSVFYPTQSAQGNGSNQFSLPWATGETWKLNGGPHRNDTSVTGQVWSSIDLQGTYSVNNVRAVNAGTVGVSSSCPNYVLITHPDGYKTGYYHLANVQVSNGQYISRGTYLGDTSTQAGCGGYATGPHVHFSFRNSSNQGITINGIDFGGWTVQSNGVEYGGCLVRVSDGFQACKGTGVGIYNDGSIGSGNAPGPTCPATTATGAYVCTPTLTPAYANNSCSTYWYPFSGFNGNAAYLTENAQSSSSSSNNGRWTPNLQIAGTYKVEAYVANHDPFNVACSWGTATLNADTSNANYVVHSINGDTTVVRDQLPLSNQWLDLGQYAFNVGTGGYVTLSDLTGETRDSRNVSFSAMRFTLVNNPVPTLSSISPATGIAGGDGFNLTVTGTNFTEGSVVRWNGSNRTTAFVTTTQLIASIPASDIAIGGIANVTVYTPAPGGGTSSAASFTIESPDLSITSLTPTATIVGGGGFTLTVNGSNFMDGAVVKWSGSNRTTAFINSTQLTASISAADISASGDYEVTVTNPSPSNKTSNAVSFLVSNPIPVLNSLGSNKMLAGSSGFTLVVNGSYFINGATVMWDGSELATNYVSASRLDAQVPASYLREVDEVLISVSNPAPSDGISGERVFDVYTFADVSPEHIFWRYIEGFYAQGITTGCSTNPMNYCPDNPVTRAAMAVFLLRAKNGAEYQPPAATGIFTDLPVTGKEWMQPWVEEFYREGITTGCSAEPMQYCPENSVTRAAMAVFLLRAKYGADYQPPAATGIFADLPVTGKEWMEPWVEQFYREGITTGCEVDPLRYCPEDPVKRQAMAVFIDRSFGIPQLP